MKRAHTHTEGLTPDLCTSEGVFGPDTIERKKYKPQNYTTNVAQLLEKKGSSTFNPPSISFSFSSEYSKTTKPKKLQK